MPFITANDLTIYYETHGNETGIPLVLLSGLVSNHLVWKPYIASLSKKFKLILLDNRGSGQTESPEIPYSIKMMAEDTSALLEAIGIASAHFVGHSMGGAIVQQLCIDHPDRVKKAIICASAAHFPATAKLQTHTQAELFQQGVSFELLLKSVLPWVYSNNFLSDPDNIKKAVHEMIHNPYPQTPAGYAGQINAITDHDLRDKLHKIQAKTWIIAADQDLYTPIFCSEFLCKHIPDAELKIVKNQAHFLHIEEPKMILQLILNFFG